MANAISSFDFSPLIEGLETHYKVRVVTLEGAPWFVAADVCRALGMDLKRGTFRWLTGLPADEKQLATRKELPQLFCGSFVASTTLISEPGLYRLVMRSDKPVGRQLQDWVTRVVLPAIRKDGAYVMGEEKVASGEMSEDELVLKALGILQRKVERLTKERDALAVEVNRVTIDEYRALKHAYWDQGFRVKVGRAASKLCRTRGIEMEHQVRFYPKIGRDVEVNVYDRELLDEAVLACAA